MAFGVDETEIHDIKFKKLKLILLINLYILRTEFWHYNKSITNALGKSYVEVAGTFIKNCYIGNNKY